MRNVYSKVLWVFVVITVSFTSVTHWAEAVAPPSRLQVCHALLSGMGHVRGSEETEEPGELLSDLSQWMLKDLRLQKKHFGKPPRSYHLERVGGHTPSRHSGQEDLWLDVLGRWNQIVQRDLLSQDAAPYTVALAIRGKDKILEVIESVHRAGHEWDELLASNSYFEQGSATADRLKKRALGLATLSLPLFSLFSSDNSVETLLSMSSTLALGAFGMTALKLWLGMVHDETYGDEYFFPFVQKMQKSLDRESSYELNLLAYGTQLAVNGGFHKHIYKRAHGKESKVEDSALWSLAYLYEKGLVPKLARGAILNSGKESRAKGSKHNSSHVVRRAAIDNVFFYDQKGEPVWLVFYSMAPQGLDSSDNSGSGRRNKRKLRERLLDTTGEDWGGLVPAH